MNRYVWPLLLFLVLAGFLAFGLRLDPREVPSPLIGKPAPAFTTTLLGHPEQTLSRQDLLGKVWVLNVWASWCVPCREEHPLLVQFARQGLVPLYGLNYKDQPAAAEALLRQGGNPYTETLVDPDGRIGIDYGVYGVPETYVIDRGGVIRYKHIGPLTPAVIRDKLEPLVRQLLGERG
ncbi:MAG: DsbE family thiol:disulfide interchange protein [Burkholderiales bacterium]|nr:DsbE family thiol:disulfide interchange protein [Burkholderiales bacterium]MDE2564776.1 DsbE family thiol:disulfide interchange protein [Burkholderiales bacterium]